MSRSRRFSGNLIVQPEVVEQRLRTGVSSVYCPAWRGHIALVGETRRLRSKPGSDGGLFRLPLAQHACSIPRSLFLPSVFGCLEHPRQVLPWWNAPII